MSQVAKALWEGTPLCPLIIIIIIITTLKKTPLEIIKISQARTRGSTDQAPDGTLV